MLNVRRKNNFFVGFPRIQSHTNVKSKFIYNDYHVKSTAPGFSRNEYGKPFLI